MHQSNDDNVVVGGKGHCVGGNFLTQSRNPTAPVASTVKRTMTTIDEVDTRDGRASISTRALI